LSGEIIDRSGSRSGIDFIQPIQKVLYDLFWVAFVAGFAEIFEIGLF